MFIVLAIQKFEPSGRKQFNFSNSSKTHPQSNLAFVNPVNTSTVKTLILNTQAGTRNASLQTASAVKVKLSLSDPLITSAQCTRNGIAHDMNIKQLNYTSHSPTMNELLSELGRKSKDPIVRLILLILEF